MRTADRASSRILRAAAAAAAAVGLLAGCSTATAGPTTTRTVTVTPSATSTPAASAPPTSGAAGASTTPSKAATSASPVTTRVDPNAPAGQCADTALRVTVQYDPDAAGAGQRGAFVVFRNTGSSACDLEGAPGLSLVGDGNGTQIGAPAQRSTSGAKLVSIQPGRVAVAAVQYTYVDEDGGNFGDGDGHDPSCQAKAADGYRVYPPHSYRAFFSSYSTYACSTDVHWISVGPVRPAADFSDFTPTS